MNKLTPTQIAKARYDEAHQILEAWNHRLAQAQAHHYNTTQTNGDTLTSKRNLNATELEHTDAQAHASITQQAWINAANHELWPTRKTA